MQAHRSVLTAALDKALRYLTNLDRTYQRAGVNARRAINQSMFEPIEVGDDAETSAVVAHPYRALLDERLLIAAQHYSSNAAAGATQPAGRPDPSRDRDHACYRS